MVKQYRKKPVCIEAVQFTRDNWEEITLFTNHTARDFKIDEKGVCTCIIPTLEGAYIANENDWIIKGIHGELYPCKPDIFEKTYEPVAVVAAYE